MSDLFYDLLIFLNKYLDNDIHSNSDEVSLPIPTFTASLILCSFFSSIYTQCPGVSPLSFPFSRRHKSYTPLVSFNTFVNSFLPNICDNYNMSPHQFGLPQYLIPQVFSTSCPANWSVLSVSPCKPRDSCPLSINSQNSFSLIPLIRKEMPGIFCDNLAIAQRWHIPGRCGSGWLRA